MSEDIDDGEILRQMGSEPLEYGENVGPENPTSIRLSTATRRQLKWLSDRGHGNRSVIIAKAVQMMVALELEVKTT